jgi:ring-1,2-phenylacetyl-CoA epoxidase subunit PaaD
MTLDSILRILETIHDPEIPVISIIEMGMVRGIRFEQQKAVITFAPTFSGCPALQMIQDQILSSLNDAGYPDVEIEVVYHPSWSSDEITPQGRLKLKGFGISPPDHHQGLIEIALLEPVACPYCDSTDTSRKNSFGPTRCRAIYFCNQCHQPFEQFKPI